ncbi:MAG: cytochrome d ubiquinol oxidase subunit II [Hyphomicrobiales bacterium]
METLDLPLIWAIVLALAVFMYVVLDGFDLGIGILFPFAGTDSDRSTMMNSIAPVWDGNETWLVLGGGGMLAAFPVAFGAFMPSVYMPIGFMLTALIFRGVAFELRFKSKGGGRKWWGRAFNLGSLVAALSQGLVLGAFVQGTTLAGNQFAGGAFDWLTPFSVLVAIGVASGYTLLGATWVIMKSDGALADRARGWAGRSLLLVLALMAMVSCWVLFLDIQASARWGLSWPVIDLRTLLPLAPVPLAVGVFALWLNRALQTAKSTHAPFFCAVALFALGYLGLAISIFPYIVPYRLTVWQAAAAPNSQAILLVGVLIMLPLILCYTASVYWVFRGKASDEAGYTPATPGQTTETLHTGR